MVNVPKQLLPLLFVLLYLIAGPALPVESLTQKVPATESRSSEQRVLVFLSGQTNIYQSVLTALKKQSEKRHTPSLKFEVLQIDDADISNISLKDYAAVLTVGTKAARTLLVLQLDIPVLSVLVPKTTFESLVESVGRNKKENRYSVIYIDQPFSRELYLSKNLVADAKNVGVLLGPYSGKNLSRLEKEVKRHNLGLNVVEVDEGQQANRGIRDLVRNSDVLLAIPDPVAFTSQRAKWFLYQAYQQRVAVIAFSKSYVDAGSLAAVYSTPEQIGHHASEVLWTILQSPERAARSYYPKYFSIAVNESVARSLHIPVPDIEQMTRAMRLSEKSRD